MAQLLKHQCQVCGYTDGDSLIEHMIDEIDEEICVVCFEWAERVVEEVMGR